MLVLVQVLAPIYIGRAMQRLHEGEEDSALLPLAQYVGLLLLSATAKNCQSIVYASAPPPPPPPPSPTSPPRDASVMPC